MTASRSRLQHDKETSVGYQLRKTFRKMEALLKKQIEPEGISIERLVLPARALGEKEGLKQRELAELVGMMQPTTVSALQNMEQRGLVRMEPDESDRRVVRIYLTDEGRRLKKVLMPRVASINDIALKDVGEQELKIFMSTLRKIQRNTGD